MFSDEYSVSDALNDIILYWLDPFKFMLRILQAKGSKRDSWTRISEHIYEGIHTGLVTSNSGIEGTNNTIKAEGTFRERLNLFLFTDIAKRLIVNWGKSAIQHLLIAKYLQLKPDWMQRITQMLTFGQRKTFEPSSSSTMKEGTSYPELIAYYNKKMGGVDRADVSGRS